MVEPAQSWGVSEQPLKHTLMTWQACLVPIQVSVNLQGRYRVGGRQVPLEDLEALIDNKVPGLVVAQVERQISSQPHLSFDLSSVCVWAALDSCRLPMEPHCLVPRFCGGHTPCVYKGGGVPGSGGPLDL